MMLKKCEQCAEMFIDNNRSKCPSCGFVNTLDNMWMELYKHWKFFHSLNTSSYPDLDSIIRAIEKHGWWFEISYDNIYRQEYVARVRYREYPQTSHKNPAYCLMKAFSVALEDKE